MSVVWPWVSGGWDSPTDLWQGNGVRTRCDRDRHGKDQVSGRFHGTSRWLDELGAGSPGVCHARLVDRPLALGLA
jgi:hypothetical protein